MPNAIKRMLLPICLVSACALGTLAPQARQQKRKLGGKGEPSFISSKSKLLKRDREWLAQARAEGKSDVMVVIASAPGANASVANEVVILKGNLRYRDDQVDYLRAAVPIESVYKIARLSNIEALGIDTVPLRNTSENEITSTASVVVEDTSQVRLSPPDRNTPVENPYLATRKIGAPQFIAKHPTFDGRGVTIAVLESGIPDMLCPELQTATTLEGRPTRKLIDVLDAYDPIDDDDFKVPMLDQVQSLNGHFTYKGVAYAAPANGDYRIGMLDETNLSTTGIAKGDFNLDGNPPGSSRLFGVLWDKSTNRLWVDTNQDHSFSDETSLTDYNLGYEAGILGKDNPTTATRKTAAFVITADVKNEFIRLFPLLNSHVTTTMSAAAGRGFFGGKMNGVAPGAKVISVMNSFTNHGLIEGMIMAVRHAKVDLVSVQVGSIERLKDGSSAISTIWDRLIDFYKKPIFIGAGNIGPGINTSGETSFGSKVISVGGYVHKDTWLADEGVIADRDDYVINLSSRGPRQDGGFKPDIITPSLGVFAAIATRSPLKSPYELPAGYTISAGTSEATPMAAGAAALLISGAKQTGIPCDAERLRQALKFSARYLPRYAPYEQGDGLVQLDSAWHDLQKMAAPVAIISRAPVNHVLSKYLNEPDEGPGIYEREGWTDVKSGERRIYFTRTSGQTEPTRYLARWLGNDGTFTSQETVTLPLNAAVSFSVTVSPKTLGAHSGILRLIDPSNSAVVYEVMNTVIAAEQFSTSNGFSVSGQAKLNDYPGYRSYFFSVPENTAAFKFDMNVVKGNLRAMLINPYGLEYGSSFTIPRGVRPPHLMAGTQSRTVVNPEPGVWEVAVVNHDFSDVERNKDRDRTGLLSRAKQEKGEFTFIASVFGLDAQPAIAEVELLRRDSAGLEVSFTNRLASFVGSVNNASLGSGYFDTPTLTTEDMPQVYEISVPPGSESLRAQIRGAKDSAADLDLYLYECTDTRCGVYEPLISHDCKGDGCELKAFSIGSSSTEAVEVINPNPGKWKVVIDPVLVPSGKTKFEYMDLFTHPSFGEVRSEEKAVERSSGMNSKAKTAVRVDSVPEGRRYLAAVIQVVGEKPDIVGYTVDSVGNLSKRSVERRVGLGTAIVRVGREKLKASNR